MAGRRIFVACGEASGDDMAAAFVRTTQSLGLPIEIHALGGNRLSAFSIEKLEGFSALEAYGLVELIPTFLNAKRLLDRTAAYIASKKFDALLTFDSKGFNFRLHQKLKELDYRLLHFHVVSPSFWAFKNGERRAAKLTDLLDHIFVLNRFEAPFFDKIGLKNTFVGNYAVQRLILQSASRSIRNCPSRELGLFPGSRVQEIRVLRPMMIEAMKYAGVSQSLVFSGSHRDELSAIGTATESPDGMQIITSDGRRSTREEALSRLSAALCASGTMSTELATVGTPQVVLFKPHRITEAAIRMLASVRYVNLINIIANEELIPELKFGYCTTDHLTTALSRILEFGVEVPIQERIRDIIATNMVPFDANFDPKAGRWSTKGQVFPFSNMIVDQLLESLGL